MSPSPAGTAGGGAKLVGAARRTADALLASAANRDRVLGPFVRRASTAGVPPTLIDHARELADRPGGQRPAIACLRLATRVAGGDRSAMTPLLHKLGDPPDDRVMWDTLRLAGLDVEGLSLDSDPEQILSAVAPEAERSFASSGYSTVIEWLATRDRLPESADTLMPLIRVLVEGSIARRDRRLGAHPDRTTHGLRSVIESIAPVTGDADHSEPDLAAWGPSLLDAVEPDVSQYYPGPFELASFLDRDVLVHRIRSTGEGFEIVDVAAGSIAVDVAGHRVEIVCVRREGTDLTVRTRGHLRRHHDTGFAPLAVDGLVIAGPGDVARHLDERFGDRTRRPLFFDAWFDCPNTSVDRSLEGLLVTEHQVNQHIRNGDRLDADVWTARLRDAFGADYTKFVPTPIDRRVLATPVTAHEIGGRPLVAAVGSFDVLDADTLRRLGGVRSANPDAFVVAAVVGDRSTTAADRLRTIALSNLVDAAILIAGPSGLPAGLDGSAWTQVVRLDDAGTEETR